MTDDQKAAIFDEIAALNEAQYMQPGDVTLPEYMTARDCERSKARRELAQAVKLGLLIDAGLLIDPATGRRMRAYRRANDRHTD